MENKITHEERLIKIIKEFISLNNVSVQCAKTLEDEYKKVFDDPLTAETTKRILFGDLKFYRAKVETLDYVIYVLKLYLNLFKG